MNMSSKLVSICIPSYNYSNYISDVIESVLSQTYKNIELIIADDCSSDDSVNIIKKYAEKDARINLYVNTANLGMIANWNYCLQLAHGEYVKLLCADDVMGATCIEKQVQLLDRYPEVSLVTCGRLIVDKSLRPMRTVAYATKEKVYRGQQVINRCLFDGNYIGEPSATMFRRKDAQRGFNSKYRHLIDLEMWFHLLEQGDLAVIPDPLCKFRQHDLQGTKNNVKSLAFLSDEDLLLADFRVKPYVNCSAMNILRWKFKVAYSIWLYQKLLRPSMVTESIERYLNFKVFMILRPVLILTKKIIKIVRY